jgi:hypothetical protein
MMANKTDTVFTLAHEQICKLLSKLQLASVAGVWRTQ